MGFIGIKETLMQSSEPYTSVAYLLYLPTCSQLAPARSSVIAHSRTAQLLNGTVIGDGGYFLREIDV